MKFAPSVAFRLFAFFSTDSTIFFQTSFFRTNRVLAVLVSNNEEGI
jgi:hypothetical protein